MTRSVSRGFTLIEALLVVGIVGILAVLALPDLGRSTALLRAQLAAQEVARALHGARMTAVRQGQRVAVRFNTENPKRVTYTVFQDGNGNGVRNRDIRQGIDPPLGPTQQLQRLGKTVRFGFPPGIRPRQIGHPQRYLDRLDDPIRFNRSDLASFDPLGTSTPGTVYLTAGRGTLVAVRVFNRTGKIVVMTYDPDSGLWRR